MDIHRINTVLAKAIVGLQEAEVRVMAEAMAVGVTSYDVPSPKGMAGAYRVPSPAELGQTKPRPEVDSDYAAAHAVKDPAGWMKLFDSLKPGQTLWVDYRSVMGKSSPGYVPFKVGRKSNSKKYNYSAVTLLAPGQGKTMERGWQPKLYKQRGKIDFALGDMGTILKGLYLQKKGMVAKGIAEAMEGSPQQRQDIRVLRKAIDAFDEAQQRVFAMADVVAGRGSEDHEFAARLRNARDLLGYAQKVIQSGSMGESLRWRQDANAGWPDLKGLQFAYKRASAEAQKAAAVAMGQVKPALEVLNRVHAVFLRAAAAETLARRAMANKAPRSTEYDVPSPLAMGFTPKPSKQWEKKKVQIGDKTVSASVRGVWGVAKGSGGWVVFYAPTGEPVSTKLKGVRGQTFRTQQLAKLVADGWIQAVPEFLRAKPAQVKALFQRHHEKMRQIAVDVADPGGKPLGYHSDPEQGYQRIRQG